MDSIGSSNRSINHNVVRCTNLNLWGVNMKKEYRSAAIIFGLCAVSQIISIIVEIASQTYFESIFRFGFNIFCAVFWSAAFVVCLKRYRSKKED